MSRSRVARALLAAVALLILALAHDAMAQLLSPGPLSQAHSSLEGDTRCGNCHTSGKRVDQGLCIKCHGDLGARITAGQGLHGLQYQGQPCEKCHVEHLGRGVSQIRWPGGDSAKLDHGQTGWPLDGAHKTTTCTKCHDKANSRGAPTFLGLSRTCVSCHSDRHDGRFGTRCANCHDETAWNSLHLQAFDHNLARFPLRGAHSDVQCAKCHSDPPKYIGLAFTQCGDCHADPHAGRLGTGCTQCHENTRWKPVTFAQGGATHPGLSLANGHTGVACRACHDRGNLVGPSKGSACVSCHKPVHAAPFGPACASCHGAIEWLGLPRSVGLAAHARTAYPLTGQHGAVACASCHKPELPKEQRFRQLAFARCADCHQDSHRGEFASRDRGECGPCHATSGFRPTLFGIDLHASTSFALVGKHVAAPCSACHSMPPPRLDFHVAKQVCADCHANPHGDHFAKEMAQGGCAHCHEARGWDLPKFDHSAWPLTGAHATAQCDSCHHPSPEDRKAGHGPSYRDASRSCSGCHDDPHLGQFRLTQPVVECDRCHTTQAFKIPSFNHEAIAGWALTGAHATTECTKCHPTVAVAGERPTVRWRGPSTNCKFCHATPHERSLADAATATATPRPVRLSDAVPCMACHSTESWRLASAVGGPVRFDHSTTGFPLTDQHAQAACVSCHRSARPVVRECASCHEDFHRGRLSSSCDKCHSAAGWQVTRSLEIHRRTRFPLTGMHVLADCTQCHRRASEQRFTDAPIECYGCHEQDYRRPGIFPVHVGTSTSAPLPRDCSQCHRAIAWVPAKVPSSLLVAAGSSPQSQVAPRDHDVRFPIGFGSHRTATCSNCHASLAVPRAVRCIGCHAHDPVLVMQQHHGPVATDGAACLSCHPGGARR